MKSTILHALMTMQPKATAHDETVIAVERAGNALRRGQAVKLAQGKAALYLAAAEISGLQAAHLLTDRPDLPVVLGLESVSAAPQSEIERAALRLLRTVQLVPVAQILAETEAVAAEVTVEDVQRYNIALGESLEEVAQASLPLKHQENGQVRVFRPRYGGTEHLALVTGKIKADAPPLVRLHSSCLTGDLLGSLRCDCGDQLQLALRMIGEAGSGILCYLNQEGRGIGIANKIRAYALQDQGQDTLEANESLGFAADERQFHIAAAMLKKLGISKIRLLTNNPAKVKALQELGITVTERVPLVAESTAHNENYLQTKARKLGHWL